MARNYREGSRFAVPLRQGGYAVGLVARVNPRGVLLGYFFGPRHDVPGPSATSRGLPRLMRFA